MSNLTERIKSVIRDVPDFPKPGILFKDITPILLQPSLIAEMIDVMADHFKDKKIDALVGIEARGYLFGVLLAQKLKVPFVMIRKAGKLPAETIQKSYDLEYGTATIEMHTDAVQKGMNVLIHDDLLATGGTAKAAAALVESVGANVSGFSFIIDLEFLKGVEVLQSFTDDVHALIKY